MRYLYAPIAIIIGLAFAVAWHGERAQSLIPWSENPQADVAELPQPAASDSAASDPTVTDPTVTDPIASDPTVTYYEDQTLQATAEYMRDHTLTSEHEVVKLAATHVLMGVFRNGESSVARHPYYGYPIESLLSGMGEYDAIAAAVLAERLVADDPELALYYTLNSVALSGKIGPLMSYEVGISSSQMRADIEAAKKTGSRPATFETLINQGDPITIRRYAIDAFIAESSAPKYGWIPLDPTALANAPEIVRAAVEREKVALRDELAKRQSGREA